MAKKICSHCKKELGIVMFGKVKKDGTKRRAICKQCAKLQKNEYRKRNISHREDINKKFREIYSYKVSSDEKREKMRACQKDWYLKQQVGIMSKERKCIICGTIFNVISNDDKYCSEKCEIIGGRRASILAKNSSSEMKIIMKDDTMRIDLYVKKIFQIQERTGENIIRFDDAKGQRYLWYTKSLKSKINLVKEGTWINICASITNYNSNNNLILKNVRIKL